MDERNIKNESFDESNVNTSDKLIQSSSQRKKFKCKNCSKIFFVGLFKNVNNICNKCSTKNSLKLNQIKCEHCTKQFRRLNYYKFHLERRHNIKSEINNDGDDDDDDEEENEDEENEDDDNNNNNVDDENDEEKLVNENKKGDDEEDVECQIRSINAINDYNEDDDDDDDDDDDEDVVNSNNNKKRFNKSNKKDKHMITLSKKPILKVNLFSKLTKNSNNSLKKRISDSNEEKTSKSVSPSTSKITHTKRVKTSSNESSHQIIKKNSLPEFPNIELIKIKVDNSEPVNINDLNIRYILLKECLIVSKEAL